MLVFGRLYLSRHAIPILATPNTTWWQTYMLQLKTRRPTLQNLVDSLLKDTICKHAGPKADAMHTCLTLFGVIFRNKYRRTTMIMIERMIFAEEETISKMLMPELVFEITFGHHYRFWQSPWQNVVLAENVFFCLRDRNRLVLFVVHVRPPKKC